MPPLRGSTGFTGCCEQKRLFETNPASLRIEKLSYLKVWLDSLLLFLFVIRTRGVVIDFPLTLHLVRPELLVGEGVLLVQSVPSGVVVKFVSLTYWYVIGYLHSFSF